MVDTADVVDAVFEWQTEGDYEYSSCRLSIYWITWDKAIVFFRNRSNNPDNKIVDISKKIMLLVSQNYDLAPNKTMLIEHYITDDSVEEDTYLQVLRVNNEAIRYEIKKSELIKLIGKPI